MLEDVKLSRVLDQFKEQGYISNDMYRDLAHNSTDVKRTYARIIEGTRKPDMFFHIDDEEIAFNFLYEEFDRLRKLYFLQFPCVIIIEISNAHPDLSV